MTHDLYWHGCYTGSYDLIAPESFAHPAKMAPALCFKILAHLKELGLLSDADVILDPMGGTGLTNICAGAMGYKSISVELEDKFIGFEKQNKEYAERRLYKSLDWTILQGDSRYLSCLLNGNGHKTVTSPPYGKAMQSEKCGIDVAKTKLDYPGRQWHEGRIKQTKERFDNMVYSANPLNIGNLKDTPLKTVTSPPYADSDNRGREDKVTAGWSHDDKHRGGAINRQNYGDSVGQIGALPDKPLKTVTSPPYDNARGVLGDLVQDDYDKTRELKNNCGVGAFRGRYGNSEGQIGKEQSESYLSAMSQVYSEIAKVSDVLVVVVKNPTRGGKLRRLDLDTIKLLENTGWKIHCQHRALLFEELEQADLFTGTRKQVKGRLSFFKRLSWQNGQPVAGWEDIIFATR